MSKPKQLPIIPLPANQVLLPGVTKRIHVSARPDILALLRIVYGKTADEFVANSHIAVGCVPLKPPAPVQFFVQKQIEGVPPEKKDEISEEEKREQEKVTDRIISAVINPDPSQARPADLYAYGVVARIVGLEERSVGGLTILVEGVSRFKVGKFVQETPYLEATVEYLIEDAKHLDQTGQKYFNQLKSLSRELLLLLRMSALSLRTGTGLPPLIARRVEQFIASKDPSQAGLLANFMVSAVESNFDDQLAMLTASTVTERLEKAISIISRQVNSVKDQLRNAAKNTVKGRDSPIMRPGPNNRFRQQGQDEQSEEQDDMAELAKRLESAQLSPEAAVVAGQEMKRLKRMSPAQAEYQVCRNYIENILDVPWTIVTDDKLDASMLARARKQLNDDHYGLEKIKRRLLEYLAVLRLKRQLNQERIDDAAALATKNAEGKEVTDTNVVAPTATPTKYLDKSPILLLVGPPGTGKTSLAKSVATALGRKFHRISLGGVRDEAEIRGHRRTYVAAMPGVIVAALKKVGVANPVILLDEIDKVGGSNFHGDPSAAMLEVLDPEQNWSFTDHYLSIPLDLSKVLFIATANSLDTIPPPLLDRMETIHLSGYTSLEKKHIASQHLIPKQLSSNGLSTGQVELSEEALLKVITSYTREAGVRNLEREIGSVMRGKAVEYAEAKDAKALDTYKPLVQADDLEHLLGIEKYEEEIAERSSRPGVVTGLVAYSTGGNGSILFIEMSDMPGTGRLQLTGHLGDVLKESVQVALAWVKSHAFVLGLTTSPDEDLLKNKDIAVHCPAGAVPKDGPSAGTAMTICLISLFSGRRVPPTLAMTGEISLRGKVTAVGGIREKTIGALRAGVKTVLLPSQNRKEGGELPIEVREGMEVVYIRSIWDAMKAVWPDWTIGDDNVEALESRL